MTAVTSSRSERMVRMIKLSITVKDGRVFNETQGEMITGGEIAGLFKVAGMSLGRFMSQLPREAAIAAVDALMDGMEEAKKDLETTK